MLPVLILLLSFMYNLKFKGYRLKIVAPLPKQGKCDAVPFAVPNKLRKTEYQVSLCITKDFNYFK